MRSDIFLDPAHLVENLDRMHSQPRYLGVQRLVVRDGQPDPFSLADFFTQGSTELQIALFGDLYHRSVAGQAYHESPHPDFFLGLLTQVREGRMDGIFTAQAALLRQLVSFRTGARADSASILMRPIVNALTINDMAAVAAYLGGLPPHKSAKH